MARHLRVEFPGAIYHVTCRMIGESVPRAGLDGAVWAPECCLFRDDADRVRFLDRLAERVEQYNVRLYLFVLMTNHTHLVFETPEANCSRFMHSLSTAYSVYYNLRHGRHGHLLDGRFKGKLVEGDAYLLALSRYVHLNPVCVGTMKNEPLRRRIRHLRRYSWSSYPSWTPCEKLKPSKNRRFFLLGPLAMCRHNLLCCKPLATTRKQQGAGYGNTETSDRRPH